MKRELFQNTKVQPYTSGDAIDRKGFLSAVLGCVASAAGELKVTITHSDDNSTYEAVSDEKVFVGEDTTGGVYTTTVAKDDLVNVDIDLIGCKQYVKIAVTGAGSAAIVLGDTAEQPV
ncbi:MAG: hypothetical protein IJ711_00180 [Lachnospiraceae bacterium]|nr:hypothetical protein [Clostridia bacterium]MBR1691172.1 hypothetical protein [Lachnospiraceae bacterium]